MSFSDIACIAAGFFWGYFFVPVYMLAKLLADLWSEGRWLEKALWSDQTALWKVTFICAAAFTYVAYLALGMEVMRIFTPHVTEPESAGRLWAIGGVVGFLVCGALKARSTWTRRKRRTS